MNKQLIQDIIKAGNKAMDILPVKYTVETKVENYQVYNGIYFDDNHIEFDDDYDNEVYLEYDTYDDELKDSVDKCFDCI